MRGRLVVVAMGVAFSTVWVHGQEAPKGRAAQPPVLSTTPTPTGERPEPSQMSGYPLQVGDLPPGTVAVRVVRRSFGNNAINQPVELQVTAGNRRTLQSTTDPAGRAVFSGLQVGETVIARTSIDGELLQSQIFELPAQGGVRVALVAGIGAGSTSGDTGPVSSASPAQGTAAAGAARWWIASGIFAVLGVGLWIVALRAYRRGRPAVPSGKRDVLFQALIALEDEHAAGRLATQAYQVRRARLIDEIVEIDAARQTSA